MRRWFRHFARVTIGTYLVILIAAYSQPERWSLLVGEFGLGKIGAITCLVVGAAWAFAYSIWQYSRGRDKP